MKALSVILILGWSATAVSVAADDIDWSQVDASKLPPAAKKENLTYEKDIKTILKKSCFECHGEKRQKGDYRMDSREALIKGGDLEKKPVTPGKSQESPLVLFAAELVEEYEMPPPRHRDKFPKLTDQQIGLLRAWIDQGAK